MSKSPDHPRAARDTCPMMIPSSIFFSTLVRPSLVALRYGLVAGVGSERDRKSIELDTTCFPTRCLAISHLVVHFAQVSKTFPRTDPPLIG